MENSDKLHTVVRHEPDAPSERSTCGLRRRLLSKGDPNLSAWVHKVDIDGAKQHYHKHTTEIYYVLEGSGSLILDGVEHQMKAGSVAHIPPGVVHGAIGRMSVLVVGIPAISEDDLFFRETPGRDR